MAARFWPDEDPIGKTLRTRMWLAPAAERPTDPDEQIEWLYQWWQRLNRWVHEQGEETAAPEDGSSR